MKIKELFTKEKKPVKGLLAIEWVVMGYLVITTLLMLFTYTKVHNPGDMLWGRMQIVFMTIALWAVSVSSHTFESNIGSDGITFLVVSRHIRVQPHVPQPRPCVCLMGAGPFWLSAGTAVLSMALVACFQRANEPWLLVILSDDSRHGTLFLLLAL